MAFGNRMSDVCYWPHEMFFFLFHQFKTNFSSFKKRFRNSNGPRSYFQFPLTSVIDESPMNLAEQFQPIRFQTRFVYYLTKCLLFTVYSFDYFLWVGPTSSSRVYLALAFILCSICAVTNFIIEEEEPTNTYIHSA